MASIVPITARAFAPYGEVLPPIAETDRDADRAAWTAAAEKRLRHRSVRRRCPSLPAGRPSCSLIEAHPNSPQLSVSFDSPWVVTVRPGDHPGQLSAATRTFVRPSFLVPPGTAVIAAGGALAWADDVRSTTRMSS